MSAFSHLLVKARKRRSLSRRELAVLTGIHITQLGRYETGKTPPKEPVLAVLSAALALEGPEKSELYWHAAAHRIRNELRLFGPSVALDAMLRVIERLANLDLESLSAMETLVEKTAREFNLDLVEAPLSPSAREESTCAAIPDG
jgi:transcriptional regulator with XRE-family HTH domain